MGAVTSLNTWGSGCTESSEENCGRASPIRFDFVCSLRLTSPRMLAVFYQCSDFNKDLSRWDVSSVTNMYGGAVTSPPLRVTTQVFVFV